MMDRNDPEMQMLWSPLSREGQERFTKLRAAIRMAYGPQSHQPPTQEQRLRERYAKAARRSGDDIFFETFGSAEQLLRQDEDDEMCADLFVRSGAKPVQMREEAAAEPDAEPTVLQAPSRLACSTTSALSSVAYSAVANGTTAGLSATSSFGYRSTNHVSQLAKPTRLKTPKRISLKRPRVEESSAEKALPLRKQRVSLADTTNIMHTSTSTATMTNPWDRHGLKTTASSVSTVAKPFGTSKFTSNAPLATSAFGSVRAPSVARPTPVDMTSSIPSARMFALR